MQKLRGKYRLMSVNQICTYHLAHNIIKNSSSEQIKLKWSNQNKSNCFLRSEARIDQKVSERPTKKCTGFSYYGAKLYNKLPCEIKKSKQFKSLAKEWIWNNKPSY